MLPGLAGRLPGAGVARLVATSRDGRRAVLMVKAGHNGEHPNHNDVGSFILTVDGEELLTDPGRGLYTTAYWDDRTRYRNVFASSYGHSVPRIGGLVQAPGRERSGTLEELRTDGAVKQVRLDLAAAYPLADLSRLHRTLRLGTDGTLVLQDVAVFAPNAAGRGVVLEEAFVTWLDVVIEAGMARVIGQRSELLLTVEDPPTAAFCVQRLERESRENAKGRVLSRLAVSIPDARTGIRIRMQVLPVDHGAS